MQSPKKEVYRVNTWMGWTAGVCCAAVGCALMTQMHPSGALRKSAQCVLAVFFLAVLILPLPTIEWPDFADTSQAAEADDRSSDLAALMRRQITHAAAQQVEQTVRSRLADIDIAPVRVTAQLSVNDDVLSVEKLTVVLHGSDRRFEKTVRIRIRDMLDTEPEILYGAEGGERQ